MTTLQQIDIILNNERMEVIEHEITAAHMKTEDRDLALRYKGLVKRHKELLDMVVSLVKGVSDRADEALNNQAVIEQNHYNLQKRNFELYHMCAYDTLTEVYSRKFILEAVEKELLKAGKKKETFVVAMVDLDNFKAVNDGYGHPAGDRVLKTIAQTMKDGLRPKDMVGRYGGDEFLLILPKTSEKTGFEVLKRIGRTIENCDFPCVTEDLKITASFGLSTFESGKYMDYQELIYDADQALLKTKKEGKNDVRVYGNEWAAV